jgi:acetyl esterase
LSRPVDPGLQRFLDVLAGLEMPSLSALGPVEARRSFSALASGDSGPEVAGVHDRAIPGPAGDVPIRVYRPVDGLLPVLVWYHGGGFVIGDLDTADGVARRLAVEAGCIVVSVDYRLAPEHPFPAAIEDAWAALEWVSGHADTMGGDPGRIAVGGDSSGGNLAAVTALRARDEGIVLRHQLLVYPSVDLDCSLDSESDFGDGYFLTKQEIDWFEGSYLAGHDPSDVQASPLHAVLDDVAPAHVITAGYDPLGDEGRAYAAALAEAAVAVVDDRYPTMIHGFLQLGPVTPVAAAATTRAAMELARALGSED